MIQTQKTYAQFLAERMYEIHSMGAASRTYGDWWALEGEIKNELEDIRREIRLTRREVAREKKHVERELRRDARHARSSPGVVGASCVAMYRRFLARRVAMLKVEVAYRDELVAGQREMAQQDRDERKVLAKLTAEFAAEVS